jgi:23S rRNA (cytidine1920-2'-O)/16S rRNA (cytidine1409-2'-O)-methyltransferase
VRVDELLVDRGLASTRAEAARLVLAGRVRLSAQRVDKAGRLVPADAGIELVRAPRYVGRGGEKLEAALAAFNVEPRGRVCLDIGASTGGFTDCLLQHGAQRVYAVDVGHGQLHSRLRSDPRVTVLERVNVRQLDPGRLEAPASLATVDVSFISLEKVLPAVVACLAPQPGLHGARCEIVALGKPQFEVGRGQVGKGGVVRDSRRHREVLERLVEFAGRAQLGVRGIVASPLRGPKGNREFFLYLVVGAPALAAAALEVAMTVAVTADGEAARRNATPSECPP